VESYQRVRWIFNNSSLDAEKLLRIKGVIEPLQTPTMGFDTKKEELEHELSVGSSYLLDSLNSDKVEEWNKYITEKERIVELVLTAQTVNYRDCLLEGYRGVEDPFEMEITDLQYNQNPIDPSQVIREVVFKRDD
jgi:hypothetical protein